MIRIDRPCSQHCLPLSFDDVTSAILVEKYLQVQKPVYDTIGYNVSRIAALLPFLKFFASALVRFIDSPKNL